MPATPDASTHWTIQVTEKFRRIAAAHPELKLMVENEANGGVPGGRMLKHPVDAMIKIQSPSNEYFTYYVQKNRFPKSFPSKQAYDSGFGSGVTKDWLLANVDEYSRPTFDTLTCKDMGWCGGAGRFVELQGPPEPGTLVVELSTHRADLDGRVGLVIGTTATGCSRDLHVLWNPWRFKDAGEEPR